MDLFLSLCVVIVVCYVAYRVNRSSKARDSDAIEKEVEDDFKEEFEQKKIGE